ncbi:MAG: molecular chaperone HscC, partial [Pseudomonadota bacterium]
MSKEMIVGIDLGTTNSLISIWQDGVSVLVPNALGKSLTPSCVGLSDSGEVLVGEAAKERLQTHPQLTTANFKRYMGSARNTRLGKRNFRPEELSSFVLRALKADAEAYLGMPITEAVISVPAYFSDAQRKATQTAGILSGLKVDRLINEPTAAALAYGVRDAASENQYLIFDLGGGTFDVSILELFDGVMEVRASAGDNFLGGEDFADVVIEHFFATQGALAGIKPSALSKEDGQKLRNGTNKLIWQLSERNDAELAITLSGQTVNYRLSEDEFAGLASKLLERIRLPVERALRDARIRVSDLSQILLAGGATRMPIVRKLVARMFGRFPSCHINPDEVVALGAAVQAGLKMKDSALDELVMTDVCPYTLGISTMQRTGGAQNNLVAGVYLPIIERNTVVPISRSRDIYTVADQQQRLAIEVFQGEARMVKDNIPLGTFEVEVPPKAAGLTGADVRFTYDSNGILEVEATVHETNVKRRLVIQDNPGSLSAQEIDQRLLELSALKLHPREDLRNVTLLARADRLFEELLGDLRLTVSEALGRFQAVLERQDQRE